MLNLKWLLLKCCLYILKITTEMLNHLNSSLVTSDDQTNLEHWSPFKFGAVVSLEEAEHNKLDEGADCDVGNSKVRRNVTKIDELSGNPERFSAYESGQ